MDMTMTMTMIMITNNKLSITKFQVLNIRDFFFNFSATPYGKSSGYKLIQPKVNTVSFGIRYKFAHYGYEILTNFHNM